MSDLAKYRMMLFVFAGLLFSVFSSFGQNEELQKEAEKYNNNNLQEKIFVHTDRSYYLCGDIIWFKLYLVNASTNQPLSLDKVAYVEILDKSMQPVLQGKIAMKDGQGNGSFLLPSTITSGNYLLRAYTNWMKNYSPDNFFEKDISIVNTTRNLDSTIIHQTMNYSVEFFPEGGNLVAGLENEVAFKITDNQNRGVAAKGTIVDETGNKVAGFSTFKFGMGHFNFAPEAGKVYKAIVAINDTTVVSANLPKVYSAGYLMHIADEKDNLKISVSINGLQQSSDERIYLLIQNHGKIRLAKWQPIQNDQAIILVNKDSLKDGISQITVFSKDKQPVCERLYFKRPKDKMLITAKADKENYGLRSKIAVDLITNNLSDSSIEGNLSASVYRLDSLHQPDMGNIYSYLWLSSDLKGYIEEPDFYFRNDDAETNEALENLLLTQGWRKFDWENVFQNKKPDFGYVPEYSGHIITGRVTYAANSKPVAGILVYLSVPGKRVQLKGCVSDSDGMVHFDMKDFYNVSQIVMQTNAGNDSIYRLEAFSPFADKFSDRTVPLLKISENDYDNLETSHLHIKVENAYYDNDFKKMYSANIDTLPFYYKPDKTYLLDDYTRFTTMEEVMIEYVAEVMVRKRGEKFKFFTVNNPAIAIRPLQEGILFFEEDPLMLLDGVPVFSVDKMIKYDPLKVQKLEVVASEYHWGPITADGILNFTTYKGNLEGYTMNPSDLLLDYDGLQQQRIFYSPDYSTTDALQSRLPDFRDVLYWSPDVHTNGKGQGTISFYTGDIPGRYLVVLQGISSNGNAGSKQFVITVTK